MPHAEPKWMLLRTVVLWKRRPFAELHALLNRPQVLETFGRRGERYELEIHILRNQARGHEGELRLHVTIDRGGWLGVFAMSYEVSLAPPRVEIAAQQGSAGSPTTLCEPKDDPAPAARLTTAPSEASSAV